MDYSPSDSSVHGILRARILDRVAIPLSSEASQPKDKIQVPCITGRFFTILAAREAICIYVYICVCVCEIKISPDILINKKCHSHQWFLASKCEWGLPNFDPVDAATLLDDCWGAGECKKQSEQGNRIGPRWLRCIWKQWNQWTQRLASSHAQNAKFLNLIPDLWCSDWSSVCCKLGFTSCLLAAVFSELLWCYLPGPES